MEIDETFTYTKLDKWKRERNETFLYQNKVKQKKENRLI